MGPTGDLTELPLLVDASAPTSFAKSNGGERNDDKRMRAALGVTLSNRVVVARGDVSSDLILADALVKAGCVRGVLLDRGAHVPVIFDRAGTSSLPKAHYEPTVLYGIAKPMAPRALRFIAEQAVAQAK